MTAALKFHGETARRYLVMLAISLWLGGFTFYSVVVIHTAHHVLDSMLETGLITQQVSRWLNLIGVGALLILLWNTVVDCRQRGCIRWILGVAWIVMAAVQIWLFLLHPVLDRQIDLQTRHLVDRAQFRPAHTFYVTLSTVQWAAGLIYVFCMLHAWRLRDRLCGTRKSEPVQSP
ncbi:MAG: hypothetical protein ACXWDN_17055, partial [Limisphaerales bacterium]